ncbi:hypothetical protein ACFVWN_08770 [Nocardiopsis flavescens]
MRHPAPGADVSLRSLAPSSLDSVAALGDTLRKGADRSTSSSTTPA